MKSTVLFKIIFTLCVVYLFVSCNTNDEEPFEALSDVYYINQIINDEARTGIAYYAFGSRGIMSATVTPPGGGRIDLEKSQSHWFTWLKEPDIEEYISGYPSEGIYNFEITSEDGEVLQSSDELEIDTLAIPEITEIVYNTSKLGYNLSWEEIENAHVFRVNIKDADGNYIFSSPMFNGQTEPVASYEVLENSGQWFGNPLDGQTYTFQVQAIRFDNDADDSNYIYNFEEISIGETEVIWGS